MPKWVVIEQKWWETAVEFIRRFLQHILPKGFVKVRYYGFFSSGQRQLLSKIAAWFSPPNSSQQPSTKQDNTKLTKSIWLPDCPHCGQPLQLLQKRLPQKQRWQPP